MKLEILFYRKTEKKTENKKGNQKLKKRKN